MDIKINGNSETFDDGLNVTQLLKAKDVEMPEMVSVELNGEILERDAFETTIIKENDELEFLYFMGGGQS